MSPMQQPAGTVESLWRYPVKSMAGEELDVSEVTPRGLVGDRVYALVDESDSKVATAKNPRKWPRMFEFGAVFTGVPRADAALQEVLIDLPDGTTVSSSQADVDAVLSRALARKVSLRAAAGARQETGSAPDGRQLVTQSATSWAARSEEYWPDMDGLDFRDVVTDFDLPEGTFFDAATVHVLTTSTLERLHELYPEGEFAIRRFRPNIVVDADRGGGFIENDWVGRTLQVGDEVQLAVTEPCSRCVMVTLAQAGLPKDSGVLRTVARNNDTHVGVYASVVRGGRVRRGDTVTLQ